MIALEVADVGDFMQKFLKGSVFDRFYLVEGEVATGATFHIDGKLNSAYFGSDEAEIMEGRTLSLWSEIKPIVYDLMKGKKLPVAFHFVLQLSCENCRWLLEKYHRQDLENQLAGLYLNIRYQEHQLTCVTGLSYKTFVMDKTMEHVWDDTARQFMKQNNITVSVL